MEKTGVIYILTNPSFPEYVKIGYADDIDRRLQQLNRSECIPYTTTKLHADIPNMDILAFIEAKASGQ